MANRMLVGDALRLAANHVPGSEADYESLLNGLATSLGISPRHVGVDGDNFYALIDVLTGLKDLYDVLDAKLDTLDIRVDTLESYH